jgi:hypothetical protein
VFTARDTREGISLLKKLIEKQTSTSTLQNIKSDCTWSLRVMTNRTRKENKDGIETINTHAGEQFIDECLKLVGIPSNTSFYIFHRECPMGEAMSFARYFPEYLSHASDYFKDAIPYGTWWENYISGSSTTTFLSYIPREMKRESSPTSNGSLRMFYVNQILNGVAVKLKTIPSIDMEVTEIRHIYNPILLKQHRAYYAMMYDKFNKNKTDVDKTEFPQTLLAFHGTNESNLTSFFETGFLKKKIGSLDAGYYGKGYYLTTYPQYAVHYINIASMSKDTFKMMDVGSIRKIIGGYVIPGMKKKIEDLSEFGLPKDENDGFDSHMVRVKKIRKQTENVDMIDFFPIKDKGDEQADEIVVFDTRQFLPCFEISLKRIK